MLQITARHDNYWCNLGITGIDLPSVWEYNMVIQYKECGKL